MMINEIGGGEIEYNEMNDKEWLVAPVTLIKSMRLHKGYVPEEEVAKSAPAWNGIPLTLNHPRNASGDIISANSPEVAEKTWLGHVFNAQAREDDTMYVDGEAWFDIENARELGGKAEQIVNDLEDSETISVSSSYFGDPLPTGNYDGEQRDQVRGHLKPDHVAVLPDKSGRCSIEDGCQVGVAANSEDLIVITDDPESSEESGMGEDTGEDAMTNDLDLDNPDDHTKRTIGERVIDAFGWGQGNGEQSANEPAESGDDENNMSERTQELVSNHGFDEENLPPEDTECFDRIYDSIVGNDDNTDETDDEPAVAFDSEDDFQQAINEQVEDTVGDVVESRVEEALAQNQEKQKKGDLADSIIGNSDDWSEDDREELLDTPESVLEDLASNAEDNTQEQQTGPNYAGQVGASANAASPDSSDMPSLSASGAIEEDE